MAIRARWHIVCSRLQCVFSDLTAINWRFSFKSQLIGRFIIISFITSKTLIRVRRNNRRIVTQRDSVSLQLHTRRTTISSLRLLLTSMERTSIVADCYISMLIAGMECCSYFVLFFFVAISTSIHVHLDDINKNTTIIFAFSSAFAAALNNINDGLADKFSLCVLIIFWWY